MLWIIILVLGICFFGLILQFWLVILSTVLGAFFWGTTGGIVGFIVGCFLQTNSQKKRINLYQSQQYYQQSQAPHDITRLKPIIELVSYYTTFPDQNWSSNKVNYVKNTFRSECRDENDLTLLKDLLKERRLDLAQILREVLTISDYETRITIFKMCCQGLNYNNYNDTDMERILVNLAANLQLHILHYQTIIDMFKSHSNQQGGYNYTNNENYTTSLADAYQTLGISETTDQAAVIKAYRKKMMQYHPDKNPNASETEKEKLNEKVSEIQTAKERIIKSLG
ncbi:DnaJ domain-containing protein [Acinetobacter nectaris]|uniref:DnaJ domain-containing protein n=1 Tax=Acinetobacter nectaris TaxID=1219382 RepID=UPI001F389652|nr:DnaJ domain-containing protein [Acinetobacter nectaris]MCF8999608.1 DnaJ domain-containing protein [Acinetobacter nectaris]MCF9028162.1 DnaJ domain-containing protein [Acinetobacter nectaris]